MCEIWLENSYSIAYFFIVRVFDNGNPLNSVLDQLLLLTFNLRGESKPIRRKLWRGLGNAGSREKDRAIEANDVGEWRVTIGTPPPTSNWYSV